MIAIQKKGSDTDQGEIQTRVRYRRGSDTDEGEIQTSETEKVRDTDKGEIQTRETEMRIIK